MPNNKNGSIFLLTLTCLSVLFILGFSMTFFTGSEDYSSSMTYESEVAFNLAESAIDEFVARLKNSLNHDDDNNQLYKVLRAHNTDVSKEIPLEANQVAKLTSYTRETSRQIYGIQFGRGLVESKDFVVDAVLKLQHLNGVEAPDGEKTLYKIKKDQKEKQGELEVRAMVNYRGHTAKVTLKFLIRVVKTFVPPFNYFTLYVKDASVYGGSDFNTFESSVEQKQSLRLDHGWNAIRRDFNPTVGYDEWERDLAKNGNNALTPPGRVYLGQELQTTLQYGPAVIIRSTNGSKGLFSGNLDSDAHKFTQINAQENFFLQFDVPWMGLKDYVDNYMKMQVEHEADAGWFKSWKNDTKIRVFNVGAGQILLEGYTGGPPSFVNSFKSFDTHTKSLVAATAGGINSAEGLMKSRLMPDLDRSGLKVFGAAPPLDNIQPLSRADFSKLSPTIVYGPATRQYFRSVQVHPPGGEPFEFPFIDLDVHVKAMGISKNDELTATQAWQVFEVAGVPETLKPLVMKNWDLLPKSLKAPKRYDEFKSNSGGELYNKGLGNFLNRLRSKKAIYGKDNEPLAGFMGGFMENPPYPYDKIPAGMEGEIANSPMLEFYEGPVFHALPDSGNSWLLDFYFIPRSTEDFFRGRTTVAVGGNSYDRFEFKYINNVQAYRSGANNQTLELNGVLALNDSEPLGLRNLKFRGHGIIYSSPMMGGGKVVISGDLLAIDTDEAAIHSSISGQMLTIVAPQIVIDTTAAQGSRCYVEANLISVSEPLIVRGDKPITIKGTVVTPYMNLKEHFNTPRENIIVYNALNGIWRNVMPSLMDKQYVAKIVTGGVGKFDWKYERE